MPDISDPSDDVAARSRGEPAVTAPQHRTPGLPGRPVLILGMHRSGTSCLAGCLQAAGLISGEVNTEAMHNARGNRENLAVMLFNDEVLAANGGSWRTPPDSVVWSDAHRARAVDVLREIAGDGWWGFKDPRTLLTLDGWLDVLGTAELAASFRHPLAVARSLHRRDATLSLAEGLALWLAYNTRLLRAAARCPVRLINYDRHGDAYLEAVTRIATQLGLPDPAAAGRFYDTDLRHQGWEDAPALPAELEAVYRELTERAG